MNEPFSTLIKLPLSNLCGIVRHTGRFFYFLMHSGTRYRIHSPFLYKLVEEVVRGKKKIEQEIKIEELRKSMAASREKIIKTDYGTGGKGNSYEIPVKKIVSGSLTPARQARRLSRLASYMKAENILEIGTSLGLTSSYLAFSCPQGNLITLEGCPEVSRLARENFRKLGIENAELLEGPFSETLERALKKLGKADLVYIDGNHTKEALLEYFNLCMNYIHNNTVIVCDDIHSSREMEMAWEVIIQKPEVTVSLDFFSQGWIFFRKELSREHFRLRYF